MRTVLSLCDRTGNMVQPWLDAGYQAITVDLQESPTANPRRHHFVADVTRWRYPLRFGQPAIVFAFPPCTHLAVSGARWFAQKGMGALIEGLSIVDACREICEACGSPWMLENPVSTLATYWRKPDYTFHPWQFTGFELGDNYTKKTCLWTAERRAQRLSQRDPDGLCPRCFPGECHAGSGAGAMRLTIREEETHE